jgi:hypothetical protein
MEQLLTAEKRSLNQQNFDSLISRMRKQIEIIAFIKNEILSLKSRFNAMCQYFATAADEVTPDLQTTYNIHITAYLAAVKMYLIMTDSNGQPYINHVTDEVKTSNITLEINFPNYVINQPITTIDNVWVDPTIITMYIGDQALNCLSAEQITTQYSGMVIEEPTPYLSRNEFLTGIAFEVEKLTIFHSRICLLEQKLISGIKYVSDLKTLGLY